MTARRLSADAKARLAFTHDRLSRALAVGLFARRVGRISKRTQALIAELKRDHDRAIEGKPVAAYDAWGGRGRWEEEQKRRAA